MAKLGERDLLEDIVSLSQDPLSFVYYVFRWDEGELEGYDGPRKWQTAYLKRLGERLRAGEVNAYEAIREAVCSGHGCGKSALVAWIILWAMSTFEDCRGIVTANTENQLKGKTWPELAKWHRLSINSHWFKFTATALYSISPRHEKNWRFDMVPWSEKNTEAFAGLHNKGKRLVVIFDEASAIPDNIWEVTEGALTDEGTEIIWAVFGNPTRNTGRFRECWGRLRNRWKTREVDSRDVEGTNKKQFEEWIADYGIDSDFVRVRVRGIFPRASDLQLIPTDLVAEAQRREARSNLGDPLIMALDIARGGDDNCVFRFRRGLDARSVKPIRIPGTEVRDSMRLVGIAMELIETHKPDVIFYDGTGVGGPVGDRLRELGHNIIEVQFGSRSPDMRCANMRAYMYYKMRDWLQNGGAIDEDYTLEQDLTGVEYTHNVRDELLLEKKEHMKSRGLASPDDGDALAMTFAYPVGLVGVFKRAITKADMEWDPMEEKRL